MQEQSSHSRTYTIVILFGVSMSMGTFFLKDLTENLIIYWTCGAVLFCTIDMNLKNMLYTMNRFFATPNEHVTCTVVVGTKIPSRWPTKPTH